jgi:hypothetical protein
LLIILSSDGDKPRGSPVTGPPLLLSSLADPFQKGALDIPFI